jgi:hypothetical protein
MSGTGRSLAVHIALSSAIGEASRRNLHLAGRRLAACLFCRRPECDQREPERSEGSSRARSASDEVLPDWQLSGPGRRLGLAGETPALLLGAAGFIRSRQL